MKKLIFALGVTFATLTMQSAVFAETKAIEFVKGKQYTELSKPKSAGKNVIEVFSFNCPACYTYEIKLKLPTKIAEILPKDAEILQYHLTNFGPMGKELSEAWAIANVLDLKTEVKDAIFNGLHKDGTINSEKDLIAIFEKLGTSADKYKAMKNDFLVKAFLSQQDDVIKRLPVKYLPTFYVNEKYRIEIGELTKGDDERYIDEFLQLTKMLLTK